MGYKQFDLKKIRVKLLWLNTLNVDIHVPAVKWYNSWMCCIIISAICYNFKNFICERNFSKVHFIITIIITIIDVIITST